ncbi:hypothetical protein SK128_026344 [Halocaridina rubra]|uniref:Uncharacterized protein n=1 Tax=Halocaridina rubra TaxID=373956 RepID=A0AAN8XHU3_HALRR
MQAVERRRDMGSEVLNPFYALPQRKTSAQIIREARAALSINETPLAGVGGASVQRVGVRTVQTKRPFTPRERERTLFSRASDSTTTGERPPSSFTLSPLNFDSNDTSGRNSATQRLVPLASIKALPEDPEGKKLPSIYSARRVQRHQFRALSLCDLPEESEDGEEGGKTPRRLMPPTRSSTINTLHSLPEESKDEAGPDNSAPSHNSSPSPESRPDEIKKVKLEEKLEPVTSSPLFQQLLNNNDLEVSDLESSLRLRREFQGPGTADASSSKILLHPLPAQQQVPQQISKDNSVIQVMFFGLFLVICLECNPPVPWNTCLPLKSKDLNEITLERIQACQENKFFKRRIYYMA